MLAEARRKVMDSLKRRDIRELVYFHCDHFEPWRGFQGDVSEKNADDILDFCQSVERIDYSRKLTLFYKCNNYICTTPERTQLRATGDEIGFAIPTARETHVARRAMEHIAHKTGHEIQVHYHHEFFTGNERYCWSIPALREFFKDRNTPALDRARWEVGLSLALETIRLEANIPLQQWFFVHGNWALNGSDADVCTITDEISRLMKLGCLGDFTFPAGRSHCDPRYEEPVFVRPVEGMKAYDTPEAEATPAFGSDKSARQGKFFLWSSAVKASSSSIDYYSSEVRRRCESIEEWVEDVVEKSVAANGTLFVKTHSHSMYGDYFRAARRPVPPHMYPGVQNFLCTIFDGATDAGVDVKFETASEVYGRFAITPDQSPGRASRNELRRGLKGTAPAEIGGRVLEGRDRQVLNGGERLQAAKIAIDQIGVPVLRNRIRSLGSEGAGCYSYYESLVEGGELLQSYEMDVAKYLIANTAEGDKIVEIGCGIGALVLSVAAAGRNILGVEGDLRRAESFRAVRDAVAQLNADFKRNSRIVEGFFPDAATKSLPRDAVGLFTNTVCGMDIDGQKAIIVEAAAFDWMLFDACRFFAKRTTPGEIEELLGMFVDAGLERPRLVVDLGDDGRYFRTSRKPIDG